jgi:PQQ-like domain
LRKEEEGYGAVRALDPQTGERTWDFKMTDVTEAGILTTASDLLFSAGGRDGYFYALDARSGALLWKTSLGAAVISSPMTYPGGQAVRGSQRWELPIHVCTVPVVSKWKDWDCRFAAWLTVDRKNGKSNDLHSSLSLPLLGVSSS